MSGKARRKALRAARATYTHRTLFTRCEFGCNDSNNLAMIFCNASVELIFVSSLEEYVSTQGVLLAVT